jgi:hypothetical protein
MKSEEVCMRREWKADNDDVDDEFPISRFHSP